MSEPRNDVKPGAESFAALLGHGLAAQSVAYYEALAERLGLNASDLRSLELLSLETDLTPGRLADLTGLTTGAVTGVLDRLEKVGLVERQPDPQDRRRIVVRLVPERVGELTRTLQPLARATDELLTRYAPAERAVIADYLQQAAGAVEAETARLRVAARGGFIGDTYSSPLDGASRGRLMFDSGAPRVSMNVAPFGPGASARIIMETSASRLVFQGAAPIDDLIRGTFDGPLPGVRANAGEVTVRYRRTPFASRTARLALNPTIPWSIELAGGITDLTGSLDGVPFTGLDLSGGTNHLKLDLPAPVGTVPIRIRGVASCVVLRRPEKVPVMLRVKGGISRLRLDDERHGSVGGDRRFSSTGFGSAPDRYEIEVLDGASDLKVTMRPLTALDAHGR